MLSISAVQETPPSTHVSTDGEPDLQVPPNGSRSLCQPAAAPRVWLPSCRSFSSRNALPNNLPTSRTMTILSSTIQATLDPRTRPQNQPYFSASSASSAFFPFPSNPANDSSSGMETTTQDHFRFPHSPFFIHVISAIRGPRPPLLVYAPLVLGGLGFLGAKDAETRRGYSRSLLTTR